MAAPPPRVSKVLAQGTNGACADCGSRAPTWCSATYGVIVCINCAGVHRSLGTMHSFVRSLTLDELTEDEIRAIEIGGNDRAAHFFKSQNLPKDIKKRYVSPIAKEYAKALKAKIDQSMASNSYTAPPPFSQNNRAQPQQQTTKPAAPAPQRSPAVQQVVPITPQQFPRKQQTPTQSLDDLLGPATTAQPTRPVQSQQSKDIFALLGGGSSAPARPQRQPASAPVTPTVQPQQQQQNKIDSLFSILGGSSGTGTAAPSSNHTRPISGGRPNTGSQLPTMSALDDLLQPPPKNSSATMGISHSGSATGAVSSPAVRSPAAKKPAMDFASQLAAFSNSFK